MQFDVDVLDRLVTSLSADKHVTKEDVLGACETAIGMAVAKEIFRIENFASPNLTREEAQERSRARFEPELEVAIDPRDGSISIKRWWSVVSAEQIEQGTQAAEEFMATQNSNFGAPARDISRDMSRDISSDDSEDIFIYQPECHLTQEEAKERFAEAYADSDFSEGSRYFEVVEDVEIGRIGAHIGRNVIRSQLRKAQRVRAAKDYEHRIGEKVEGTVKALRRSNSEVVGHIIELNDLSRTEAFLPKRNQMERDIWLVGDTVQAALELIEEEERYGPQLILSRTSEHLVSHLMRREVPELRENIVEIMDIAREANHCTKIAVRSLDGRIDPVGACVGIRGVRIQEVSRNINDERIDMVSYSEDPEEYIMSALGNIEPISMDLDYEKRIATLVFHEDNLPRAIGRSGQNVRIAMKLTSWAIEIMGPEEAATQAQNTEEKTLNLFKDELSLTDAQAQKLLKLKFDTVDSIAYAEPEAIMVALDFNGEQAQSLIDLATDKIFSDVALDVELGGTDEEEDARALLEIEGMAGDVALALREKGILTVAEVADLAVYELQELVEISDESAGALILAARQQLKTAK